MAHGTATRVADTLRLADVRGRVDAAVQTASGAVLDVVERLPVNRLPGRRRPRRRLPFVLLGLGLVAAALAALGTTAWWMRRHASEAAQDVAVEEHAFDHVAIDRAAGEGMSSPGAGQDEPPPANGVTRDAIRELV